MSDDASIRLMPLYTHLERIESGLAAQGIGPRDAIPPERLFRLDQWHYHGTEAIRAGGPVRPAPRRLRRDGHEHR